MLKYDVVNNQFDEWVVFIHGIGGSTKTWKKQIGLFSEKYNLLLIDLPGHGQNSNKIIRFVDPKELNNSIKTLLDYLNIKHAHFVGLSLGTIVIANFAMQFPSYIKSIILGGAALNISGSTRLSVSLANSIKRIVPYQFLYQFFAWFMMPKSNHRLSRTIFLREAIKLDKETMFAWIGYLADNMKIKNLSVKLESLNKKILFISGDEDHCFLRGCKSLASNLQTAEIKIIEHCGHICSIEKANIFNNYALAYLAAA